MPLPTTSCFCIQHLFVVLGGPGHHRIKGSLELQAFLQKGGTYADEAWSMRPRRFNARELSKVGVTIADAERHLLRCNHCGKEWVPVIQRFFRRPGARFRR